MEINDFSNVMAVVAKDAIVEGRFVRLTTHAVDYDFGSYTDLPGVAVPATADEAEGAIFIVTWGHDNRKPPYYEPTPSVAFSERGGFSEAANVPFSATVRLTYPGYQDSQTIPSGTPCLAYSKGIFTIPSGQYIDAAELHFAGANVIVANTAEDTTDAGKPKYQAAFDDRVIGFVHRYDSTTGALTIVVNR